MKWISPLVWVVAACSASPAPTTSAPAPGPERPHPWPMFRGDPGHAGDRSSAPPLAWTVAWRVELGERIDASPVIADNGRVYAATRSGTVAALDLDSGVERRRARLDGGVWATPALWRSWLLVATDRRALVALDVDTLERRWKHELPSGAVSGLAIAPSDAPSGAGDRLYLCSGAALIAVDLAAAREAWRRPLDGPCFTTPAIGARVFVATRGGSVLAFEHDGDRAWSATTTPGAQNDGSPALAANLVLVGSNDNHLYAFDRATGARRWRVEAAEWVVTTAAISEAEGRAYIGDDSGALRALDLETGAVIWTHRVGNDIGSSPVIIGERVVAGAHDAKLHAVSTDGVALDPIDAGAPMYATVAWASRTLVIGTHRGSVIAVK